MSLKVSTTANNNQVPKCADVEIEKENVAAGTIAQNTSPSASQQKEDNLWLRILLLYGTNQHFVKPITVCRQHSGETLSGKNYAAESILTECMTNSPMDLSQSFEEDAEDAGSKAR